MENKFTQYEDLSEILLTREEIAAKVKELGKRISTDYAGKKLIAVCILKGAVMFFADLLRELDLDVSIDFMAVSSYGSSTKSTGVVRMVKDLDHSVTDCDVLVVEDIVDSGMTLSYIKRQLLNRGASSVKIATLLDKPARRRVELEVEYSCFNIPDAFVVGYGLDYDEKYRNLPDIGILHPRIYSE